ncbi:hypothetical protein LCGC14_1314380 [marine sediment metagenome]|uniref:Uncharacterized protein n=1 Tax=marine sediment metagenome TaxID=412755 RepID=A0A0F9N2E1_9ZZZZ
MAGIKDIKNELSELRITIEKLTKELQNTNVTIRESLNLTAQTIKEMSKTLGNSMKSMSDMTIEMNLRDTILKNLGIDGIVPGFLKKKK